MIPADFIISFEPVLYKYKTGENGWPTAVLQQLIIECEKNISAAVICEQMGRTPPWAEELFLRADGYECEFCRKD